MTRNLVLVLAAFRSAGSAQAQIPSVPSAGVAAKQAHELQAALLDMGLKAADFGEDRKMREKEFEKLQSIVSSFVIASLQAAPKEGLWQSVGKDRLRDQLTEVLGRPPYVFVKPPAYPATTPSLFFVVYPGYAWNGMGGSRVVVEAYVVNGNTVRLAGRGGSELNGVDARAEMVGADKVLVQGQVTWASGHALPYAAVLYRLSETGVVVAWQPPVLPELSIGVFGTHLLLQYHNEDLHQTFHVGTTTELYSAEGDVPKLLYRETPSTDSKIFSRVHCAKRMLHV